MDGHGYKRMIAERHRIVNKAADLLEANAQALKECSTIDGEWPDDAQDAKAAYDDEMRTARELRGLLE